MANYYLVDANGKPVNFVVWDKDAYPSLFRTSANTPDDYPIAIPQTAELDAEWSAK